MTWCSSTSRCASETAPELLQLQELWLGPGEEWAGEAPAWRYVRVFHGAAYWLSAAGNRALVEGELLVIPPATRGTVRASQIGEVLLHGFEVGPELLHGLLTPEERRWFEHSAGRWQLQFLPSTHPVTRRFATLATGARRTGQLTQRAEALCLLALVLDELLAQHFARPAPGPHPAERFEQLAGHLPDSELIHQTVAGLARLCGCSPRHFSRLFRERFGESVRARQTELRLLRGRELLGSTSQKVSEIALASGYRNASFFNLLFKRRFGLTPSQWREKARGRDEG